MSVATALNLTRETVQEIAVQRWPQWSAALPALTQVDQPTEVDRWLLRTDPAVADQVLRALAQLAATDGENDTVAATLLAWVMLPAARNVAGRFGRGPEVDEHVAAQLWIEVRSYPWQTNARVAPSIAARLRKHLAAELDDPPVTPATLEPAREHAGLLAVLAREYGMEVVPGPGEDVSPMEELLSVLEWGCRRGVITDNDRLLLLDVIATAAEEPSWLKSGAALLGDVVSDRVGTQWGISGRTVRRRAAASIHALAAAAPEMRIA
jgi:hypothetical protein